MATVAIIGRNYTSRLGMIRAVGKLGHHVIVIKTTRVLPQKYRGAKDIDGYSRYVDNYLYALEPDRNNLLKVILSLKKTTSEKVILIPVDDYAASTIDENIEILKESFLFPNIGMQQGAVNSLMDKGTQKRVAYASGLNVAGGWTIYIKDGKYSIPDDIRYPCFPKPQISFMGDKRCMRKCSNKEELKTVMDEVASQRDCPMLIEEFFDIDKEYATLGFSDGKTVVLPAMLRMLQDGRGPHKGVTLQGEVIPSCEFEEYFRQLRELILDTGFIGLFDVDSFESGGKLYFNELNLRFGASGYSITYMGVNLPHLLINHLLGLENDYSKCQIRQKAIFVNEKVVNDDYEEGYIDKRMFADYLNSACFRFIQSESDPMPWQMFHIQRRLRYFKNAIKRIIGWKK